MSGGAEGGSAWKPKSNPWVVALVVTLGAFMEVLDTTIVNVALPHIAGSLSVSNDESTWALTTYLVSNGIVLTISGALARMIGRKRYFLICVAGFTAASLGCGISTSFVEILLFRAVQGFFGGGLQPSQQAIILNYFPPEKRQQAFSLTAVAIIIGPAIGPVVGGYLTDHISWHWIFLINIPFGIITLLGGLHSIEDPPRSDEDRRKTPRFDYIGVGFIALALGCLEVGVDRGENLDWFASDFVRVLLIASALGFAFGTAYLLTTRDPIVNLRAFADRNFALATVQVAIMGGVLYASAVLIPQFAQQQLGYTATLAGLVLAPGAVLLTMLIPVAGKLLDVVPVKFVIAAGGLALGLALIASMNLVPDLDFKHLAILRGLQTAALALLFVPISSIAYVTVPKALNDDATALFSMARNVAGGLGISASTALVTDHSQIRQAHLVENLVPSGMAYQTLLLQTQESLVNIGQTMQQAMKNAPGQIMQTLQTQSTILAYTDVFLITGCVSFVLIPTALLLSGIRAKAESGGG